MEEKGNIGAKKTLGFRGSHLFLVWALILYQGNKTRRDES